MAPSLVQSQSFTASSGTSATVTLSATGTGNCLVVYFGAHQSTVNPHIAGITLGGSADNWAAAATQTATSAPSCSIWVDWNAASGQTSVVISWAGGVGTSLGVAGWVEEWSGLLATASPVDKTDSQAPGSSTAFTSGTTSTLTSASELAVGMVAAFSGSSVTVTGPASWTNHTQVNSGTITAVMAGYDVLASTAGVAYAGTLSPAKQYSAIVVTLTEPGGTPPPPPSGSLLISAAGQAGTDDNGNTIVAGLASYGPGGLYSQLISGSVNISVGANSPSQFATAGAGAAFLSSGQAVVGDSAAQILLVSQDSAVSSGSAEVAILAPIVQLNTGASTTIPVSSAGITTVAQVVAALITAGVFS